MPVEISASDTRLHGQDSGERFRSDLKVVVARWFPPVAGTPAAITRSKVFTPGRYLVNPFPPAGYYLASITLGDRDVVGQMVEFTSGSVPLRVVYRSDGGSIRGTVEECGNATIAIAPEDPALQTFGHGLARALHRGRSFRNPQTSSRTILCVCLRPTGSENVSGFLSSLPALIGKAVIVEVKANETANVELQVTAGMTPKPRSAPRDSLHA